MTNIGLPRSAFAVGTVFVGTRNPTITLYEDVATTDGSRNERALWFTTDSPTWSKLPPYVKVYVTVSQRDSISTGFWWDVEKGFLDYWIQGDAGTGFSTEIALSAPVTISASNTRDRVSSSSTSSLTRASPTSLFSDPTNTSSANPTNVTHAPSPSYSNVTRVSSADSLTLTYTSSANSTNVTHNSLSSGAKVGIGSGAALVFAIIVAATIIFYRRKNTRNISAEVDSERWNKAELPGNGIPKHLACAQVTGAEIQELPENSVPQELDGHAVSRQLLKKGGSVGDEVGGPCVRTAEKMTLDELKKDDEVSDSRF